MTTTNANRVDGGIHVPAHLIEGLTRGALADADLAADNFEHAARNWKREDGIQDLRQEHDRMHEAFALFEELAAADGDVALGAEHRAALRSAVEYRIEVIADLSDNGVTATASREIRDLIGIVSGRPEDAN